MKIPDVFEEFNVHLLKDVKPSAFFEGVLASPRSAQYPFKLLKRMKETEQSPKHHPEGNVWNHTMLVLDEAAKFKKESHDKKVFMWAALLHDIGKPDTTKERKGRITSYDHDKVGAELSRKFLREITEDEVFVEKVAELIRWHMQILFVVNNLPFADISAMKKSTDINEVALLGFCDRLGRLGAERLKEENNIKMFLKKCDDLKN